MTYFYDIIDKVLIGKKPMKLIYELGLTFFELGVTDYELGPEMV